MQTNMTNNLSLLAASAIMLTVSACCDQNNTPKIVKYPHVERVFMHDPGQYSFLYKDEVSGQLYPISKNTFGGSEYRAKYHLIPDVKKEDFCWAEVDMSNYVITIHIHDVSEVSGAGWNHGKFGSGSTTVVGGSDSPSTDAAMPTMPPSD